MVVGEDHPVGADDRAGAQRLLHPLARHAAGEQAPERIDLLAHHALGKDIDHRRRGPAHDGGERHLHGRGVRRNPAERGFGGLGARHRSGENNKQGGRGEEARGGHGDPLLTKAGALSAKLSAQS